MRSFKGTRCLGQSNKSSTFKSHLKTEGARRGKVLLPAQMQPHCRAKSDSGAVVQHSGLLSLPESQMCPAMGKLSSAPWHLVSVAASERMARACCVEGQVARCDGFFK